MDARQLIANADVVSLVVMGWATLMVGLGAVFQHLERDPNAKPVWLADPATNQPKHRWERFSLLYAVVWIACFAAIIAFRLYEQFDEWRYMCVLVGLCLPLFLFPHVNPGPEDVVRAHTQRFGFKANVWLAVFSHIGNYWYTHYFYSVLHAKYTFPSWRLNGVPLCLYFATFFYFSFYHALSNVVIRRIVSTYKEGPVRSLFVAGAVAAMAYVTAFMETLTISGFPYYSFEDRDMAYSVGSAFYGLYFVVSFPMFFRLDEAPSPSLSPAASWLVCGHKFDFVQTASESLGSGMLVLCLLDAVRLALGIPLTIPGTAWSL